MTTGVNKNRSDRTVQAEKKNKLERARLELEQKIYDREKMRVRFEARKGRKDLIKNIHGMRKTTGNDPKGIPCSLHDKQVCASQYFRCGVAISDRRLTQWRRKQEACKTHIEMDVEDVEEQSDRQSTLNQLIDEIRRENCRDEFDDAEVKRCRSAPIGMRSPLINGTMDVFQSLRPNLRPFNGNVKEQSQSIEAWSQQFTKSYVDKVAYRPVMSASPVINQPEVCEAPSNSVSVGPTSSVQTATLSGRVIEASLTPGDLRPDSVISTDATTTPLFIRVTRLSTGKPKEKTRSAPPKIRPHSAAGSARRQSSTSADRCPSAPSTREHKRPKSILRLGSSEGRASDDGEKKMRRQSSGVFFADEDQTDGDDHMTNGKAAMAPRHGKNSYASLKHYGHNSEADESSVYSEAASFTYTDAAYEDYLRQKNRIHTEKIPEGRRSRKDNFPPYHTTAQAKKSLWSTRVKSSVVRKTGLVMGLLKSSQRLRPKSTGASVGLYGGGKAESEDSDLDDSDSDEPRGPRIPQWRRDLLREAPPSTNREPVRVKSYVTMSKAARRRELERMVTENTQNLRDIILSEKDRRQQTRKNLVKSMTEIDHISR